MKAVVFNIHDVALFLLAIECAMLALLFSIYRSVNFSRLLLALFLFFNALIALDSLIFWGEEVRYRMFEVFPNIFFLLGLAVFLEGPVLYWFTRAMTDGNFSFKPVQALHLLPAIAAPLYLYFVYYRHPLQVQRELILEFQIFNVPAIHFSLFVTAQKLIVIAYGMLCLLRLGRYRATLKNDYSRNRVGFVWLRLLIGGFLLAWTWVFVAHLVGMHAPGVLSDVMGILGNYLVLILVNILLFYSFIHPEIIANLGAKGGGGVVNPVSPGYGGQDLPRHAGRQAAP